MILGYRMNNLNKKHTCQINVRRSRKLSETCPTYQLKDEGIRLFSPFFWLQYLEVTLAMLH